MSARDFARWQLWTHAEAIGPEFDRMRHAQERADVLNSGQWGKPDKKPYEPADFPAWLADPWAPPPLPMPEPTYAEIAARAASMSQGDGEDA